jgi:hypothetical protein
MSRTKTLEVIGFVLVLIFGMFTFLDLAYMSYILDLEFLNLAYMLDKKECNKSGNEWDSTKYVCVVKLKK